jgi:hypothetical protein
MASPETASKLNVVYASVRIGLVEMLLINGSLFNSVGLFVASVLPIPKLLETTEKTGWQGARGWPESTAAGGFRPWGGDLPREQNAPSAARPSRLSSPRPGRASTCVKS